MALLDDLSDVGVPDILSLLGLRRHSGGLTIPANGGEVQLFLEGGWPVPVSSSNLALRLGRTLLRFGLLDHEQLREALQEQEVVGYGRPLRNRASWSATLIELGERIAIDELTRWRTVVGMRERGLLVAGAPGVVRSGVDGCWGRRWRRGSGCRRRGARRVGVRIWPGAEGPGSTDKASPRLRTVVGESGRDCVGD